MLWDSGLARKYYSYTERGEKEKVKKGSEGLGKWWGQNTPTLVYYILTLQRIKGRQVNHKQICL